MNAQKRQWLEVFCRVFLRRTGVQFNGGIASLEVFMRCKYLPETAVYEMTGNGAEHERQ